MADEKNLSKDSNFNVQLIHITSGAEKHDLFPITIDDNIKVTSTNANIPASTETAKSLFDKLGSLAFQNTTQASTSKEGFMSAADKAKLDGIESGAQVNTITGVKGSAETTYRTGNVNITKDNIGLANVENKSSATIRGELTKANVTTALGYTPPTTNTTYGIATSTTPGLVKSGTDITVDTNGNVSVNDNSHNHTIANVTGLQSALNGKLNTSLKGAASGLAELDSSGKIPSKQLPSYVNNVIDTSVSSDLKSAADSNGNTITPETGKIYIDDIGDNASNKIYRWNGTTFVVISETLKLGETSSTAFDGARGKVAYTHSQSAHARVDATKTEKSTTNGNIKINGTETNIYTHPSYTAHTSGLYKIANDSAGHISAATAVTKKDITDLGIPGQDTTYPDATTNAHGLMTAAMVSKLNGIATGANAYVHPSYTSHAAGLYKVTVDGTGHVSAATAVTKADITGLGIPGQDTTYSDMKGATTDTAGAHGLVPAPENGSANRYLRSDGTWVVPPDTTYNDATTSAHGLMTAAMVSKLNGIANGANAYTHPSHTAYTSGLYKVTVDALGHVTAATAVTKSDITGLGIPGQDTNTTYSVATSTTPGLVKSGTDITVDTNGNVSVNDNSHNHTIANVTGLQSALNSKLNTSLKGSSNGLAELDSNGKVPSSQLPSYVDDVVDVAMASDLASATNESGATITPETGKIYIDDIGDNASNKTYRWSGTTYVVISETLALGETSSTAFDGARGKVAYNHSQSAHARVDATKTEKSTTNGNIKINGTETNVYTHPSYTAHTSGLYKIANDASGHVSSVTAVTKADITGLGIPGQDTTYPDATTSAHGLMTAAMVSKLNGIASGANAYTHPGYTAHSAGFYKIANDSTGHVSGATAVTKADITALGIPCQDTTYSDMKGATADAAGNHGLVPAPDKGASNRYLRSDGTWVVPPDTTYNDATTSAHGLMTAAMVTKLNSISSGANAYTHPSHTAYTSGLYKITVDALGHVSGATAVTKSDITGLGIPGQDTNTTYGIATSTTPGLVKSGGNVSVNTDGTMSVAYANSAGSASAVTWANISGKPSTYTPASHTHAVSEITNLQNTINTINSSIATKSAIGHTHNSVDITNIPDTDLNTLKDTTFKVYYAGGNNTVTNKPNGVDAFGVLSYRVADGLYGQELYSSNVNSGKYIRYYDATNGVWTAWEKVYTSVNKPSKSDVGLSNVDNTADANKSVKYATTAGSANSVAWANVSGKPSTYYTHPSYTSHAAGLYKVTVDGSGHISAATAVTKADITALGIPGQDTNTTYNDATTSAHGLMTADMVSKLNGIAAGANAYTHPSHTAYNSGLYKVTVDGTGHVTAASAVTKADITALGIPGQDTNTTYTLAGLGGVAKSGDTMSGNLSFTTIGDKATSAGIVWNGSTDGAKIYYKTTEANRGHLVLQANDDGNETIDFEWITGSTIATKSYISSDGVYHGTATYANSAGSANSVAWANVSGKPSTYTPSTHTHTIAQVTNLQPSLDAKINRSGDTMTGALNLANATKNIVGDDVAIGDYNQGGSLGIQGLNGTTTVSLIAQGSDWDKSAAHADISYNTSDQCFDFKFK